MDMWRNKALARVLLILIAVLVSAPSLRAQAGNTCVDCHSALEAPLRVTLDQFSQDVHSQKGLTCASCHGGDPGKADADAMSKAAGFKGHISRKDIPGLCGSCHSNVAYMRQYNPSLRTDQFSQYLTSVHGKLRARGDDKVAVCTDCHGVHDLRPASDSRSKVNAVNVAETCARCHADAAYMKGYGIPTDQFAGYKASVHHDALAVRGDLSAPTCTTCHGNHGAAPPGVSTVQNVCSTCHVFQDQLFEKSPHKEAFAAAGLPGCVTCHSNHSIAHPTDALLGVGPGAVCTNCHTAGDAGYVAAEKLHSDLAGLENEIKQSTDVLRHAESDGMEVSQSILEADGARDSLTKARVAIHSFDTKRVQQDIDTGVKIATKARNDGEAALKERDYRRKGLGISLLAIIAVVVGLKMYIRQIGV